MKNYKTEKKKTTKKRNPLSGVILKALRAGVFVGTLLNCALVADRLELFWPELWRSLSAAEGKVLRRNELVLVTCLLRTRSVSVVKKQKTNPNLWGSAQVER